ncbi:phosphatidylserine decarboxylase family protein [Subsaximicrobium wynnwilliamsii]|uniref:Phosphatidylserine decarboxylase proenzyme n=1 Tax=Subsaximicrobium wynnwilliamsii TaxID=291179 RepID=A0A5C6ZGM4_9FLAO|nr:phosphatidylserine decarboxylase family protein [Subsaximicrobium wynnwilliamsii]TXD82354.1 phosphatidylserine decarboxylase family protein [Subsaximicrobium wynnwilliamsii]TXD87992.1 phosphatidylserine decarboxylase family protein [Subsaximicrobium wynnwilliamsii]TXE01985.1 phosphatidylserine decarboxylase family protein [Subsaximicrobium wynnwilliamsii]
MFHKEGYKIIVITFAIVVAAVLLIDTFVSLAWLRMTLIVCTTLLLILILQFFRNPKRQTILGEHTAMSPVDGKVVVIEEVFEKEFFKDKRIQISVFMSPINVHVTRFPISGKVIYSEYHPGKFLVAWHPKSSEENERTTVVVENDSFGKVLYRQIAGAMAKRIVNYATLEEEAIQGADSGFIKFGSRVDVFLPLDANIKVKLNQKVRGGESIIAELTK